MRILYLAKDSKYGQVVVKGVEEYINTGSLSTYERLMDDFLLACQGCQVEPRWDRAHYWLPVGQGK